VDIVPLMGVGEEIGVTESIACQISATARRQLRLGSYITDYEEEEY